ncbi:MAG: TonB-dependent receptor [Gammaproteobacteria bacterium]
MRASLTAAIVASIVGFSANTVAQAAIRRDTAIAPQALAPALRALVKEREFQIVYSSELLANRESPGATGALTMDEALTRILSGTGLTYRYLDDQTVTIVPTAGTKPADAPDPSKADASKKGQALEEVVVTGTLIRGAEPASPTITLTRENIEATGFSTTQELIASLPQNYQTSATDQGFTSTGDRAALTNDSKGAAVNLRGLGGGTSLVLVNGRRLAPTYAGHFVDVSMIPLAAIERVEIVTDGASALYGSDAIGGVVNFILRKDYDGMESRVRYGASDGGGLGEWGASQSAGKQWSSGSALLVYDYDQRDPLNADQRDFSSAARMPNTLVPSQRRNSALLSARQTMGDSIDVFGDALFTRRDADGFVTRNSNTHSGSATESKQLSATAGLSMPLGESWRWEAAGSYGKNSLVLLTATDSLSNPVLARNRYDESYDMWSVDTKADGALFSLPGGDVRLAVGSSFRQESIGYTANAVPRPVDGLDRDVFAAFAEVLVPLVSAQNAVPGVKRLELTLSGRYEDYNDFGSTSNPKWGVLYSPIEGLHLRGTYSTSFRAPYLEDMSTVSNSVILQPAPDLAAPDGETLILDLEGGNANLKPEKSRAWTGGFDFRPAALPQVKLSVTYFDIDYRDRIGKLTTVASTALQAVSASGYLAPFIDVHPDPAVLGSLIANASRFLDLYGKPYTPSSIEALVDNRYINAPRARVNGIDFAFSGARRTELGTFSADLAASYLLKYEESVVQTAPSVDSLDTFLHPIDLTLRGSFGWSRSGLSAVAFLNYQDSYTDNIAVPNRRISSWTTFDLTVAYDFASRISSGVFQGVKLSGSVQNLFDRDPPFVSNSLLTSASGVARGFDPANANPYGRTFALSLTKRW